MSKLSENFEQLMKKKIYPSIILRLPRATTCTGSSSPCKRVAILLLKSSSRSDTDYVDAQIVYHVHSLADRAKEAEALDLINELNEMKSGYYNFYLAGDGEIFLRTLMRLGPDLLTLYTRPHCWIGDCPSQLKDLLKKD